MFYKRQEKVYYPSTKRVTITSFSGGVNGEEDEGVRSIGYSEASYNFDVSDGALKDGEGVIPFYLGLEAVCMPNGIYPLKIYFYKCFDYEKGQPADKFLAYGSDGYMYAYEMYGTEPFFVKITNLQFLCAPIGISYNYNGDDVFLMSTEADGLKYLNGLEVYSVDGAPPISSMCIYNERLFVTSPIGDTSLWFSDDFNPTNWNISLDEAGFINMLDNRGAMLRVLSFEGYAFVFRTYGISRISAYGDQTDFSVVNLCTSQGRIYGKSVTMCGDNVIYLAEDGFYRFNGVNSYRVMKCYDKYLKGIDNENAEGIYSNGKLYMLLKMKVDGVVSDVVIVYKLDDKSSYLIKDVPFLSLSGADGNKRYAVAVLKNYDGLFYLDDSGNFLGAPLEKIWKSVTSDFQIPSVKKCLEKIRLLTDKDVTLTVTADNKNSKAYKIKGGGIREVKPYIKGEVFSFEIKSVKRNSRIVSPTLYFSWF